MLTLKETQNIELEIMKKIHDYCDKHGLLYCITYGTLIGAVRHKGFIPWDNDIDIIMPRPDYEKLLQLVKTNPIGENIECVHYTTDQKYHYQVIRICDMNTTVKPTYIREQPEKMGVWVDIFPADGVPESIFEKPFSQLLLKFYRWVQLADIYAIPLSKVKNKNFKSTIRNILKNLVHLILPGKNNVHEYKVDKYATRFSYDNHQKVADIIERQKPLWLTHDDFNNRVLLDFENYKFYAPKNWDNYLNRYYGDYMEMPPVKDRMTHDIDAEWR